MQSVHLRRSNVSTFSLYSRQNAGIMPLSCQSTHVDTSAPAVAPSRSRETRITASTRRVRSTAVDAPSQLERGKLTEVLEMPLAENSHELVTLRFEDGSALKIRKALLALVSPVLAEIMTVEPAWFELTVLQLKPEDVRELLPIAHLYHMEGVMNMITTCTQTFQFTTNPYHPMYVMTWLELAGQYEAPELGMACAKFILSQMSDNLFSQTYERNKKDLLARFKPNAVRSVSGPPDIVRIIAVAVQAQAARMGMGI